MYSVYFIANRSCNIYDGNWVMLDSLLVLMYSAYFIQVDSITEYSISSVILPYYGTFLSPIRLSRAVCVTSILMRTKLQIVKCTVTDSDRRLWIRILYDTL